MRLAQCAVRIRQDDGVEVRDSVGTGACRGYRFGGMDFSGSDRRGEANGIMLTERVVGERVDAGLRQRVTLPALRHEVQTLTRFGEPLIRARTR